VNLTAPLVFVVDDDEEVRKSLDRLLRSLGFRVETFASPEAFLERAPYDRPGCLVLDIRLPGRSGLELQEWLARTEASLPIVFITGYGDIPTSVRAMKAGAVDFLPKPFDDQMLLDAVEQALARDAASRAGRAEVEALWERAALLTPREHEVFCLVVAGLLNKQIAARLGTTEQTIKVHRSRVMEKLQAESLAELVRLAADLGLPGPSGLAAPRSAEA
jgi:FixJ family two-component response regulator